MSIKTRSVIGWLAWGGAAFGIVNLGHLPGDFEEALCGPWG
jgi:hypothetical protein